MKKTFTVKEVAKLLGFSTNTVYKYLLEGKIKATRLGKEGRFRIPAQEIDRMVPSQNDSKESNIIPSEPEKINVNKYSNNIEGTFSLFDWFISLNSILFGLTCFIFPIYWINGPVEKYLSLLIFAKVIMFLSGVSLIIFDVYKNSNLKYKKYVILLLSLCYFVSGVALQKVGYSINAIGYSAIGLTLLILFFKKIDSFRSFYLMVAVMVFSVGTIILFFPSITQIPQIQNFIISNRLIFALIWFGLAGAITYVNLIRPHENHRLVIISNVTLSILTLTASALYFSNDFWERALFSMNLGVFALIFPFWHSLHAEERIPKKVAVASFVWVLSLIAIGMGLAVYLQKTSESALLSEMDQKIDRTSRIIEDYLTDSVQKITIAGLDENLRDRMETGSQEALEDSLKNFYSTSGSYFRRYAVTDSKGIVKANYPVLTESIGTDISTRNYYVQALSGKQVSVSEVLIPRLPGLSPTIAITMPIYDNEENFLGMIIGSLSLDDLGKLVSDVESNPNVHAFVADGYKHFVLNIDENLVGMPAIGSDPIILGVEGSSGSLKSYDENGELSLYAYKPINSLNWGISVKQSYLSAFKRSSITSYVIFLVVTLSGLGSVLAIQSIRKVR